MHKWKVLIVASVCLMAAMAAVFANLEREPSYQGRSLSHWLHTPPPVRYDEDFPVCAESQEAICSIGTNAIPLALRWISYEPSALKERVRPLTGWLRGRLRPRFFTRADRRAIDAENVFRILGPRARSAIPELTRLTMSAKGEARVGRCARSLACIGPEAVPALVAIFENPNGKDRSYVMERFLSFGPGAGPAVPALINALQDPDRRVAGMAAQTLGMLGLSNSTVVPALVANLQSTNAWTRGFAATGLARFGTAAGFATPALRQILVTDADPSVRQAAAIALRHIEPETATNEPPKMGAW